ncbi:MAG TPA: hypothetical protein VII96_00440 [Acidimicrobiales bacterium]
MKWFWIAVLIVVGIVAAVFAVEYLTTSIGHLPSWVPGNHPGHKGHLHKRGYAAAVVAVAAFAGAGWLIYRNQVASKSAGAGPADS